MAKDKHTGGEAETWEADRNLICLAGTAPGEGVAVGRALLVPGLYGDAQREREANARLMAAAPEMLRALRAALDDHADGETILAPVVRQRVARVVADATGGEG